MPTFSAYWHDELKAALVKALKNHPPYTMSLVGEDARAVARAIDQGIDSHLEACNVPARGDSFSREERSITLTEDSVLGKKGEKYVHTVALGCVVSRESLVVLVRRLMEDEVDDGEAICLASGILDTLGIEVV